MVFKAKVLHFKIENTPIKDTNGKKSFKRMLSFLFCGQTKAFRYDIAFRGIQPCFFTDRSAWLVLNQQGSEVSEDTWGTFRTLWSKKSTFLKGNFSILRVSWTVFYSFDMGVKEKPQNVRLKFIFCHVLYRFNLQRNDLTCFTRIAFWINLRGFE